MLALTQTRHAFSGLHNITRQPQSNYSFGTLTPLLTTRTSIIKFIANQIKNGLDFASPRYSPMRRLPLELSIDAIIAVAEGMKQDLQRDANRAIRRNDLNAALGSLASMNSIDDFVYRLKIRSGSQLGLPKPPRKQPKSPLRQHLEAEAKKSQELPEQLLLPETGGPIAAKKRRSA